MTTILELRNVRSVDPFCPFRLRRYQHIDPTLHLLAVGSGFCQTCVDPVKHCLDPNAACGGFSERHRFRWLSWGTFSVDPADSTLSGPAAMNAGTVWLQHDEDCEWKYESSIHLLDEIEWRRFGTLTVSESSGISLSFEYTVTMDGSASHSVTYEATGIERCDVGPFDLEATTSREWALSSTVTFPSKVQIEYVQTVYS